MNEQPTLDYAQVVIVPVANPATAHHLLRLGLALAEPEKGRVIALVITQGDAEKEAQSIDQIEPICGKLTEQGHPIELQVEAAPSVARGILDAVREDNADLVLLGLNKPDHGQVIIGAIPESIAVTAPCDVLIFRTGQMMDFERIIVPANGSEHSRIAARVGIMLGEAYQKPVEAMFVQDPGKAAWMGYGRLAAALADLPGAQRVKRSIVKAADPARGILSRVTDKDLLVLGYTKRSELERWLYGDFSRELLNHAPGPVILASRSEEVSRVPWVERLIRWARPTLTRVEQDDLVRQAREMSSASLDYTVLIIVSALLASFGLLTNSGAVIIGAMLVAPLMSPLIAFSIGMTSAQLVLMRRSVISVIQGFALAFVIALIIGLISPSSIVTDEMAGRGNPTVLDMGVALASGLIGAYATARKEIPAALAGVAIAAALMPPVCTIALGVAYGNIALVRGATLLFSANIVSIMLAAWGVFFWLGLRPHAHAESRVRPIISGLLVAIFALITALFLLRDVNPNTFAAGVERELRAAFEQDELVDFELRRSDPIQVVATVRRQVSRLDDNSEVIRARVGLQEALGQPVNLDVVIEPFYNADQLLIRQVLSNRFGTLGMVDITGADPVEVSITLSQDFPPVGDARIAQAQDDLSVALGKSVILRLILPEATAEATPEVTPSSPNG